MLAAALVVCADGRASQAEVQPEAGGQASERAGTGELAAAIRTEVLRRGLGRFWGAVVVVREGEPVAMEGFGYATSELEPIGPETLFDVGSVSKTFTALAMMRLVEMGKVSLDDKASKFFEGVAGPGAEVTIRELLSHTAGVDDERGMQVLTFADRDEAARRALASVSPEMPGAARYANAGYVVAAAVIEKVSGERFEAFVVREVFRPLGMTRTGFLDGTGADLSKGAVREVTGRSRKPQRLGIGADGWGWGLRGAGGVVTCMADMAAFEKALRAGVMRGAVEAMSREVVPGWGLGVMLSSSERGTKMMGHDGRTRGYSARWMRYPEEGVMIAVFTGERDDPGEMEFAVARVIWPREPDVTGTRIITGVLTLNEMGGDTVEQGVTVRAEKAELPSEQGGRGVKIAVEVGGKDAVVSFVSAAHARALATDLRQLLSGRPGGEGEPRETVLMVGTQPYPSDVRNDVAIGSDTAWRVRPRYSGMRQDGTRIEDVRPTLVLMDDGRGFLPVILRMDAGVAARLASEMMQAAEGVR
jgi:CubicO group peptidase (beta-lactamase class C family)